MKQCVLMVLLALPAMADPQQHYSAPLPKNYQQALNQMETVGQQLEAAERADDLRQMHELSYALENSIETMQRELDAMADDLEAMHVASEKNQKAKAKDAYRALKPRLQAVSK